MLTPLDIENKKFSKQMMNGYSVEEVDDFLDELTEDYEKLYKVWINYIYIFNFNWLFFRKIYAII